MDFNKEFEELISNQVDEAEGEPEKKNDDYFIQVAIDNLGSAIRDNSREEKIAIGKEIDEKGYEEFMMGESNQVTESVKQGGQVKWYRHDGTGYIIADDGSGTYYFDHTTLSKMTGKPKKGDKVSFVPSELMGKKVAKSVELSESNQVDEASGSEVVNKLNDHQKKMFNLLIKNTVNGFKRDEKYMNPQDKLDYVNTGWDNSKLIFPPELHAHLLDLLNKKVKEKLGVNEAARKAKKDDNVAAGAPQSDAKAALKEFAKPDMDQARFTIAKHRGLGMDIWEVTMRLPVSVDFLKAKDQDLKINDFASFHSSDPIEILAMMANEELASRTGMEFGRPSISLGDLKQQRAKGGMKTVSMSWEVGDALMAYALGLDLTKFSGAAEVLDKAEVQKRLKDAEDTAQEAKKLRQDIKAGKRPESDWPEFAKAAQEKGMNHEILKRLKLEEGVKGLPLGKRFPQAKKKLSSDDEQKLSLLYKQRDSMGVRNGSPEYVKLQGQIDKMLGEVTTTANVAAYPAPIGMVRPADRKKKIKESSDFSKMEISENCYAVVPALTESVSKIALDSYLETALWSSTDDSDPSGGDPLDKNYDISDIESETVEKAKKDLELFFDKCSEKYPGILDQYDDEQIGHDFWLTRNGHGAGFWDGDYEETPGDGKKLTEIAKTFKEVNLYVGDDGQIHGD